jgi:hypothetical protein
MLRRHAPDDFRVDGKVVHRLPDVLGKSLTASPMICRLKSTASNTASSTLNDSTVFPLTKREIFSTLAMKSSR